MKILVVHNYYGTSAPSGENMAVDNEIALLKKYKHQVVVAARESDSIRSQGVRGTLTGALSSVWNPSSKKEITDLLEREKPDIVHVHNVFPLHSPAIFYGMKNVPVVYTLHNYRIGCAAGTATRENRICFDCFDQRSVLPALRYGCYRDSRLATAPMAASIVLQRSLKTWSTKVDAFITLTEFQRNVMVNFGIPSGRMFVKPHFGTAPRSVVEWKERENKIVFIGRLYEAKGIHHAIDAWKKIGDDAPMLEIIGDGPMRAELERSVTSSGFGPKVKFTGQLPHDAAMKRLSTATMLLLPSLCPEGFPMVIHEAYSRAVPVAASNAGSLQSLVNDGKTGILFVPGSASDMASRIMSLWNDRKLLRTMHTYALKEFTEHYTAEVNHSQLMKIYNEAQLHKQAG
ncbi:MAG: glycosyltransferase family 4 protein [Ignavibacteriales bacterium]|nr:glycosyltransferase family 4 protein [Ignavibacteriales bacterium]